MVLVAVPLSIGKAPLKGLISIALFGLGLTITLTAYGAGLTAIGQIVGFQQIQGWMFTIGGAIALFFGFWMLKLVPLRMPGGWQPARVFAAGWHLRHAFRHRTGAGELGHRLS